ncbi:MAG: DUF736 family protein, partial [Janthinobacterium lividum]
MRPSPLVRSIDYLPWLRAASSRNKIADDRGMYRQNCPPSRPDGAGLQTKEQTMTTIGTIKLDSDGSMTGEINTLRFSARVRIIPNARRSESSPDFRIYAGNSHLRWQG